MTDAAKLRAALEMPAFDDWWNKEGRFIDPDTSDVPWFDKRKELCLYAWDAASAAKQSTDAAKLRAALEALVEADRALIASEYRSALGDLRSCMEARGAREKAIIAAKQLLSETPTKCAVELQEAE